MSYSRRQFFRQAGAAAAAAVILPNWACNNEGSTAEKPAADTTAVLPAPVVPSLSSFGIQLYSLRDVIPADPKGILKQVAGMGYKQVESYEHDKLGMFWGMPHTDFKKYMDELGMSIVSSHFDTKKDVEKKAAQAAEIGMKYLIAPWVGPQKKMEDWKKIAEDFTRLGGICQKAGIRFAYHNHDYSFKEVEGIIPQEWLVENTDPALVDYEMDIYWVVTGGADPIAYLKKYPNRYKLCHVKDRLKGAPLTEKEASCDLGVGQIDFSKILNVAKAQGMEYFILEQERYDNSTPVKSAAAGAEYLKKLVFS